MLKFILILLQNIMMLFDSNRKLLSSEDEESENSPPNVEGQQIAYQLASNTIANPAPAEKQTVYEYTIDTSWMLPTNVGGHAVSTAGWIYTNGSPTSVTWHWTATTTRASCDRTLGGKTPSRKGVASAHYCVGRTKQEGISQYVRLEHRSWHAGANQSVRWDGKSASINGQFLSGSRASIGVETVNIGFDRKEVPKQSDWIETYDTSGKTKMWIQPWTNEQIDMMIFVGKEIVKKYPNIKYLDHHGHHDICPGYKQDCSMAFPFAKVLSGIYDEEIPDVWTIFRAIKPRQRALELLGYNLGTYGADGDWGTISDRALKKFQETKGLFPNGQWTTFVCWEIYFTLLNAGYSLEDVESVKKI